MTIFYGFIILYHDRENNTIDFRLKSSIFFKDNDLLIRKEESLPTISIRQDRGTCFLCARLPCDAQRLYGLHSAGPPRQDQSLQHLRPPLFLNNPHGLLPQQSMKIPPYPPLVKGGWGDFHINASPGMVRRYRLLYESGRLRRKQWEVSVYKSVEHIGHGKEMGIENGCTTRTC